MIATSPVSQLGASSPQGCPFRSVPQSSRCITDAARFFQLRPTRTRLRCLLVLNGAPLAVISTAAPCRQRPFRIRDSLDATRPGNRNSCSQMRTTFQPIFRNSRRAIPSRLTFWASFSSQNLPLASGTVACNGHRCQKQPSTNRATFCLENRKSGETVRFAGCERCPPPVAETTRRNVILRRTCRLHPPS